MSDAGGDVDNAKIAVVGFVFFFFFFLEDNSGEGRAPLQKGSALPGPDLTTHSLE